MKKLFAVLIAFALVFAACEEETADDNKVETPPTPLAPSNTTFLKIKNESFIEITDVVWNNVSFTGSQNTIKTGTSMTKAVQAGTGYIYFKRQGNPIAVRTASITVEENKEKEFVFINNMIIAEVSNPGNNETLETFYTKSWIVVKRNTTTITQYGEYDFGSILAGTEKDITFTIENIGGGDLIFENVNSSRVNLGENTAGLFSIIQQPLAPTVAPGNTTTFTIRFSPTAIGNNFSADVHIKTNSQNAMEFSFRIKGNGRDYIFGDIGSGGGMIFYIEGGQYKECSVELSSYIWSDAMQAAKNFKGGGFTNWHLPDREELFFMYQNLHSKRMGGFNSGNRYDSTGYYWSSSESSTDSAYIIDFYNGTAKVLYKNNSYRVRAVRSFSQ